MAGRYSLFAVFDGHGGSGVADICKDKMPSILHTLLLSLPPDIALRQAFETINAMIPSPMGQETGSTAVVVLFDRLTMQDLWIAHCGDSRAIMGFGTSLAVDLTTDHKPNLQREKQRIENAGGFVLNVAGTHRVLGALAVSRSIGDKAYHPYVIATPEIRHVRLTPDCKYILLASDGLFDVLTTEDINQILMNPSIRPQAPTNRASALMYHAYRDARAEDNMTIIFVPTEIAGT